MSRWLRRLVSGATLCGVLLSGVPVAAKKKEESRVKEPAPFVLQLGNGEIISIANKPMRDILSLYDREPRELPLCLYGAKLGNTYSVRRIALPLISSRDAVSARFSVESCYAQGDDARQYLGFMHNHPGVMEKCGHSQADYDTLVRDAKSKVSVVVCNVDSTSKEGFDVQVFSKREQSPVFGVDAAPSRF